MILGVDKLLELVKEQKLVEGLCDRELNNPEGCGFDLRLGEIYSIEGPGVLGVEQRNSPNEKLLAQYDANHPQSFKFQPGKYYLGKTIEKVNTPDNLAILFRPRSTLFRSGISLLTGNVSPGYLGGLVFGITNLGNCEIEIELGARVVHAMFYEINGQSNLYRGQWQNGRISANQTETQV